MKILILRFSSIGDIVLTTPVIRCIKKQIPGVEIHYFTKKEFYPILKNNPFVSRLWLLDQSNLKETIIELKKEQFDYIIDLHKNVRTLSIKNSLGVPSFSFEKLNVQSRTGMALEAIRRNLVVL